MIPYQQENLTVFQSALCMTTSAVIETKEAIMITDPNWLPQEVKELRRYVGQTLLT